MTIWKHRIHTPIDGELRIVEQLVWFPRCLSVWDYDRNDDPFETIDREWRWGGRQRIIQKCRVWTIAKNFDGTNFNWRTAGWAPERENNE